MACLSCNKDIFGNGIGDLFLSDSKKELNESILKSDELQREQTQMMIDYFGNKKARASANPTGMDQQTLMVLAGVGVISVFVIIMMT